MKLKVTSGAVGENGKMGEDGCGRVLGETFLRGLAGKIDRSLCRATHLDVTPSHPSLFTPTLLLLFCFTSYANLQICIGIHCVSV